MRTLSVENKMYLQWLQNKPKDRFSTIVSKARTNKVYIFQ